MFSFIKKNHLAISKINIKSSRIKFTSPTENDYAETIRVFDCSLSTSGSIYLSNLFILFRISNVDFACNILLTWDEWFKMINFHLFS